MKSRLMIGIVLVATVLCQQVSNSEASNNGLCIGDCMVLHPTSPSSSPSLEDIYFKFDQYNLDDNSRATLKENIQYLKNNPNLRIEIQGHCDERGSNNYNIALGESRAHSIKEYIMSQGIDGSRIEAIAYGEEKPSCFQSKEECWKKIEGDIL